jgi:hypothetical protein
VRATTWPRVGFGRGITHKLSFVKFYHILYSPTVKQALREPERFKFSSFSPGISSVRLIHNQSAASLSNKVSLSPSVYNTGSPENFSLFRKSEVGYDPLDDDASLELRTTQKFRRKKMLRTIPWLVSCFGW